MDLEKNVETFLKQSSPFKKKLFLGFSGGEDSLVLAHCLDQMNVDFELAHFDHGWRENSDLEARNLKKWANSRNIPFHTMRSLSPVKSELAARTERYQFFEDLFATGKFEALLLAVNRETLRIGSRGLKHEPTDLGGHIGVLQEENSGLVREGVVVLGH